MIILVSGGIEIFKLFFDHVFFSAQLVSAEKVGFFPFHTRISYSVASLIIKWVVCHVCLKFLRDKNSYYEKN